MSIVSTKYGKMHIIDSDKYVSQALKLYGEWAMDELILLSHLISPATCVLDVGAFIGTHSLAFSQFVGQQGKVYAFEPRKEIYAVLSENLALNNCTNVTALNMGLDKENKKLTLPAIDINELVNFGGLTLNNKNFQLTNAKTYQIDIATIDSLNIDPIDLIKLDVEDMEVAVLNGAIQTINKHRPLIFCECNSLTIGFEILQFCQAQQYTIYGFLADAYNPDNFKGVSENIFGEAKELALLLIPEEKNSELLNKLNSFSLLPIHTIEDLVLPLLHKPQYLHEVLANTPSYSVLGTNYLSPLLREQNKQIAQLSQIISATQHADQNSEALQKISSLSQIILEQNKQIAQFSQIMDETDHQINNLHKEIRSYRLSSSWKLTKPLRATVLYCSQFIRFLKIYWHNRQEYMGIKGIKSLIHQYKQEIQKKTSKLPHPKTKPLKLLRNRLAQDISNNITLLFDHNGGGGSNIYSNELIKTIHSNKGIALRIYYFDTAWFIQFSDNNTLFSTSSIDDLFELLLASKSQHIIINSVYGYPDIKTACSKIISLTQALNATLDYKVHDFYALCPSPHLSDFEEKYCGVPKDITICKFCLKQNLAWYHSWYPRENRPTDITEWRKPFIELFAVTTSITFFDESSVDIMRKVFTLQDEQIKITPHEINYFKWNEPIDITGELHLGVLGTLSFIKGGHVINTLANSIEQQDLNIPITVIGHSYMSACAGTHVHGQYAHDDLPILIKKYGVNVILMLSIVPETFSYTVSEAMNMGLPIVAFDLGAQGRRVKQYHLGKVVPLNASSSEILAAAQSVYQLAQGK